MLQAEEVADLMDGHVHHIGGVVRSAHGPLLLVPVEDDVGLRDRAVLVEERGGHTQHVGPVDPL